MLILVVLCFIDLDNYQQKLVKKLTKNCYHQQKFVQFNKNLLNILSKNC